MSAIVCRSSVLLASPVYANDSTAELAAGGLIFTKSDTVEMASEDLSISTRSVKVRYHFFNHGEHDVTTNVAFPMPDITYGDDTDVAISGSDPDHILPFETRANGKSVAALVERKAVLNGVDKTETLKRLGMPIAPAFGQKFDYLSQQVWDELVQLRLIEDNPRNTGELQPRWTLKTTYYWQQTFPARQETIIDHSYVPSVGSVVALPASQLLSHPESLGIDPSKTANRFCIDQAFLNAMERASNVTWVQRTLSYVLTTGANWSGPIKQFHLTVDKGSPENLISLCIGNIRKTSSTQFEVNASSFLPTSDLNILILEPH
jgi:hypothetical protein